MFKLVDNYDKGRSLILENILFKLQNNNLLIDLLDYNLSGSLLGNVHGLLGLIEIQGSTYLITINQSVKITEGIYKIVKVHFYCLNSPNYDLIDSPELDFDYHPCLDIKKLVEFGNFYYSNSLDITNNALNSTSPPKNEFVWNKFLIENLINWKSNLETHQRTIIDQHNPFITVIQGAISVYPLPNHASLQVISRLSSKRAGTRFFSRGIDDDGQVANFVETETIFKDKNVTFTYNQIRGSVPLFWEQQGLQAFGQRTQITRPFQASKPAFEKHFYNLLQSYDAIHVLNLLGQKDHEVTLSDAYNAHLESLETDNLPITYSNLDFHSILRMSGHQSVIKQLDNHLYNGQGHGPTWSLIDNNTNQVIIRQHVVFRINCLDCLDRTNFVQDIFSKSRLKDFLQSTNSPYAQSESFWQAHRHLWAENGDALSKLYAGTGALNSSFTRTGKRTLAGLFSDATKSVTRAYVSNVTDKSKQSSIDMFLGNLPSQKPVEIYDPVLDIVRSDLNDRVTEYSSSRKISIHAGTYNVAGQIPTEDILPWLFPEGSEEPDIIVVGFQELVQLTPQQIMSTDTFPRQIWERFILETLKSRQDKTDEYIILRSEQVVGLALIVLIKQGLSKSIRSVEGAQKKTGLKGMSGNKGAAAIRLQYEDSTFCFIASHMAAGHSNIEERNNDYFTISNGLQFLKGKVPEDHDNIVWVGDFNYRIDLPYETATSLAYNDNYEELLSNDQLPRAMSRGIFKGYEEAPILFRPTYRYNFNSDVYDTSEKRRIPAYTDRILYKSKSNLYATRYATVDLRGSDHRPVYATFRTDIRKIDHMKRDQLAKEIQANILKTGPNETIEEKLMKLGITRRQQAEDNLPSPSNEKSNWWTDEEGNDFDFISDVFPKANEIEIPKVRRPPPPPPIKQKEKQNEVEHEDEDLINLSQEPLGSAETPPELEDAKSDVESKSNEQEKPIELTDKPKKPRPPVPKATKPLSLKGQPVYPDSNDLE
ncbi:DNase I-like protein [Wallemia mellicola]|uniref:phosphoinositide 5-phosphatase n=1 Tax=Wallemia mellicola TaxID=1708541 RepID=A0AB38MYC9_9BASI|nr:DNase I-like protein [Wallemia mellicola]TIC39523.1 DNase I-like protein [Wallemia mellicola]TIC42087.1 DNase I-like protein [Wallemia mellicola]TIC47776.1 DNase I-like protein [Wallemia mellicola]TIC61047.1 DNase I-like protein [Wallemia mellicola]